VSRDASGPQVVSVDSHPDSRVRNSQPHGIGRVVTLPDGWAWNNLGRNVVFAGDDLVPRAVYDESAFMEDEPSQYDLDVHAILAVASAGLLVTLNHFGQVRAFDAREVWEPGALRRVTPRWTRRFEGDVERAVLVGERLIGSRPREASAAGLLVGERLTAAAADGDMDTTIELEGLGIVTALAAVERPGAAGVVVGSNARVSFVPATPDGISAPSWETEVDFDPSVVIWDGTRMWAAGSERARGTIDDYDWEARRGGGFAALDPLDGAVVVRGRFHDDVAWGNGGVAVVRATDALCALGRTGRLYAFDERDGTPLSSTAPLAPRSLGIAHADARGDRIVFGFNRGGYRLCTTSVRAVAHGDSGGAW